MFYKIQHNSTKNVQMFNEPYRISQHKHCFLTNFSWEVFVSLSVRILRTHSQRTARQDLATAVATSRVINSLSQTQQNKPRIAINRFYFHSSRIESFLFWVYILWLKTKRHCTNVCCDSMQITLLPVAVGSYFRK